MADEQVALTQEVLKESLHYAPETGIFTWARSSTRGTVQIGRMAGTMRHASDYVYIRILGKGYSAARLAVLYMTGEWPQDEVDHIDRNRANNRWSNLRVVTKSQNAWNQSKPRNNTSGFKGVSWNRRSQQWRAHIMRHGKNAYLGQYPSPEEAHAAYAKAAQKLHGEFACT